MTQLEVTVNLLWLRPGAVGGSENYVMGLLAALAAHAPDLDLSLLGSLALFDEYPWLSDSFSTTKVSTSGGRAVRFAKEWQRFRPRRVPPKRAAQPEIIHHLGGYVGGRLRTPSFAGGRFRRSSAVPAVVTVHDTQFLDLPNNFSRARWQFLWNTLSAAVAEPNVICTVSEFTTRQLAHHFGIDPRNCHVVPPAITMPDREPSKIRSPQPDAGFVMPDQPFVLYPAVTWPHKRHEFLVDVAEQLFLSDRMNTGAMNPGDRDLRALRFVFCGAPGPAHKAVMNRIAQSQVADRFVHLGRVSDSQLNELYRSALTVMFPSEYEGVGLPVLEAMAHGCPVIICPTKGLKDTARGAGNSLLLDDDEWAGAIVDLLHNPESRAELVSRGLKRAVQFTALRSARAQLDAYRCAREKLAECA